MLFGLELYIVEEKKIFVRKQQSRKRILKEKITLKCFNKVTENQSSKSLDIIAKCNFHKLEARRLFLNFDLNETA